jgi:glycine cleavage system H protein
LAHIEKFLGKGVQLPEDRRYNPKQGLWVRQEGPCLVFGLTEPALVLMGGINDLEWLVPQGEAVKAGDTVIFAITGKILYMESPIAGTIQFNPRAKESPHVVASDPYGDGWLFRIAPREEPRLLLGLFSDPVAYMESLRGSEGFKNPEGLKGGVSGICKAVYTGIRDQKL